MIIGNSKTGLSDEAAEEYRKLGERLAKTAKILVKDDEDKIVGFINDDGFVSISVVAYDSANLRELADKVDELLNKETEGEQ